jgi:hypothetical protein
MPFTGEWAKRLFVRKIITSKGVNRFLAQATEYDERFDERMERIDQNLEKSKRSQEAIDKWLNRHPSQ